MSKGHVTILDTHIVNGEDSTGSLVAECEYEYDKKTTVLKYTESLDEMNDCHTVVSVLENGMVTMNRMGNYKSNMIFEKNKRHVGLYQTPYGDMLIGIETSFLSANMTKNGGTIKMRYSIDCNNDPVSSNKLEIKVRLDERKVQNVTISKADNQ